MVFLWIPFAHFPNRQTLGRTANDLNNLLVSGGLAFVVGPSHFSEWVHQYHMDLILGENVCSLPTYRLHQAILPQSSIKPRLNGFCFKKNWEFPWGGGSFTLKNSLSAIFPLVPQNNSLFFASFPM